MMDIIERSSPNRGMRRDGARPDIVLLHYTAMLSAEAALDRLCDPAAEVSAHYLVAEDGRTWCLVGEEDRAWHAGVGRWGEVVDVNSRSIGIELANAGPLAALPPFPEPQMRALEALLEGIRSRWKIPKARVLAHSDIAPLRKTDPGPKFDWCRLALSGHAVWADADGETDGGWPAFRMAASRVGYRAPDGDWEAVLAAVRLRFRPAALGCMLDGRDVALARALAAAHPCVDLGTERA
jgi:N-acetylmuramoyl-L-alanine amidase